MATYDQYGYILVFLGSLGENTALLGLVLPGGTLALLGAFYARQGTLDLGWVIFFAWLGTVLGYHADYLFGRFVLARFVQGWSAGRVGQRLRLAGRIRLARVLLAKHGGKAILISHTVGHMRSFVALSAGLTHMSYPRFLLFEVVAALLWNVAYCLGGYFVGMQIDHLQLLFERFSWVMLGLVVLLFLAWRFSGQRIRRRLCQSRRQLRPPSHPSTNVHNALVIGAAAAGLPRRQRRYAIVLGSLPDTFQRGGSKTRDHLGEDPLSRPSFLHRNHGKE